VPGAARHLPPLLAFLSVFGFEKVEGPGAADAQGSALAAFAASETFRWLRRWAGVAVVALVTPLTVLAAYGDEMPAFHRVAVPIAVAVIVPAWVLELSGVRWPKLALVAATVLPNVWLTLIGHVHTNYLWLLLLVPWVAFAGSLAEGVLALTASTASIALAVAVGAPWSFWFTWAVGFLLAWFMGLVLRRQVVLVAELRLLRGETERRRVEVEALYRADEQIYRSLQLDEVLQALVDVASDLLRPDKVSVGLWDAETDRIVVGAARGFSSTTVAESVPPEEAHLLREHLSRGVATIEDVQTDARLPASTSPPTAARGFAPV